MDIAGPAQVFTHAAEQGAPYNLIFYSPREQVVSHQGLALVGQSTIPSLESNDLLIVPGWKTEKSRQPFTDEAIELIQKHARNQGATDECLRWGFGSCSTGIT